MSQLLDVRAADNRISVSRLLTIHRTAHGKRFIRYSMVSVVAVVVAQAGLTLIYGVFRLPSAVWSNVIAQVISTVPAYYLNRRWVWGRGGRSHWRREILPFWIVSLAALAASIVSVGFAQNWGKGHHLHHVALTVLIDGASLATFGVLWIVKYLSFHSFFHIDDIPGIGRPSVDGRIA